MSLLLSAKLISLMCCGNQMSSQVPVVLGVDGGASKTACIAMLVTSHEQVAQACAGPSNWCGLQSFVLVIKMR